MAAVRRLAGRPCSTLKRNARNARKPLCRSLGRKKSNGVGQAACGCSAIACSMRAKQRKQSQVVCAWASGLWSVDRDGGRGRLKSIVWKHGMDSIEWCSAGKRHTMVPWAAQGPVLLADDDDGRRLQAGRWWAMIARCEIDC
jgi:hypothetical protein